MASIKDVAKLAGLSVAAVSKYLKDPGSVRESTRISIEAAIGRLGYVPSPIARSLRTKKTGMIAVVVPSITNPFFAELFDYIRTECQKRSTLAILYTVSAPNENSEVIQSIAQRQADGVILCFPDSETLLSQITRRTPELPVVVMSWHKAVSNARSIILDVRRGITDTTEHLISLGCRQIAYIGGYPDSIISKEKYGGYRDALLRGGLSPDIRLQKRVESSMRYGYRAASELFASSAAGDFAVPDSAVCENDALAIGCINFCLQNGIRIPETFRVTGFDDIPLASMFEPRITTVRLPIAEMGKCAADMVFLCPADADSLTDRRFETVLIRRNTT